MTWDSPKEVSVDLDGSWSALRYVAIRGPGFPFGMLSEISFPALGEAVRTVLTKAADLDALLSALLTSAIAPLERRNGGEKIRRRLDHAADRVGEMLLVDMAQWDKAGREIAEKASELVAASAHVNRLYESSVVQAYSVLRRVAAEPRFRRAVTWQNRAAVQTALAPLERLDQDQVISKGDRQKLHLVARHLQRYCAKNETIGFFGPIGWGQLVDDGPPIVVPTGFDTVHSGAVEFENWAIDELASTFASDPGMQRWLRPRLYPFIRRDGDALIVPDMPPLRLGEALLSTLCACDGATTAADLAADLVARGLASTEEECLEWIARGRDMGVLSWTLEVPMSPGPEVELRAILESIGDRALRDGCLSRLERLVAARDRVRALGVEPTALNEHLETLEQEFMELTSSHATRHAGATYASRTLVYQDGVRNGQLTIGPEVIARLGGPLGMCLDSARWLSVEAARRYRVELDRIYDEIVADTGSTDVELVNLHRAFLFGDRTKSADGRPSQVMLGALAEHRERWARVLGPWSGDIRRVERTLAELRERAASEFPAPATPWPSAPFFSPDVLVAAGELGDIFSGDYFFVLGEIHGTNTLETALWTRNHPEPGWLDRAIAITRPAPRLHMEITREWMWQQRGARTLIQPNDARYLFSKDPPPSPDAARARLNIAELFARRVGDRLIIKHRRGHEQFDVLDFLSDYLSEECGRAFGVLASSRHSPRVTIDRLVVARERWVIPTADLELVRARTPAWRCRAAAALARELGTQRVYVKSEAEIKPIFVDLENPIAIEDLAKLVRASHQKNAEGAISITEMLPTSDDLWLDTGAGGPSSVEVRLVTYQRTARGG